MAVAPPPEDAFRILYEAARSKTADQAAAFDRYGAELTRFPCTDGDPARLGWGVLGGAALLLMKTDDVGPQVNAQGIRDPFLEGFVAALFLAAGIGSRYIEGALPAPGSSATPMPPDELAATRRSVVENAVRSVPMFLSPAPGQLDVTAYAHSRGPLQAGGVREQLAASFPGLDLIGTGWALLAIGGKQMHHGATKGGREASRWFRSGTRRALSSANPAGYGLGGALLALAGDACLTPPPDR